MNLNPEQKALGVFESWFDLYKTEVKVGIHPTSKTRLYTVDVRRGKSQLPITITEDQNESVLECTMRLTENGQTSEYTFHRLDKDHPIEAHIEGNRKFIEKVVELDREVELSLPGPTISFISPPTPPPTPKKSPGLPTPLIQNEITPDQRAALAIVEGWIKKYATSQTDGPTSISIPLEGKEIIVVRSGNIGNYGYSLQDTREESIGSRMHQVISFKPKSTYGEQERQLQRNQKFTETVMALNAELNP